MINLKINFLAKMIYIIFDIIFQKSKKTILIAVAEEATDMFL